MPGHYIQAKIPPNTSPPPPSSSSSSTFPNTYTPSDSPSPSHHTPQSNELRPLLPRHSQPRPDARTWWGRNWRPIRFFFVVFCIFWFVIPWIWGIAWWLVGGGLGHGGPPPFVPGPGYGRPPGEREVRRVGIVGMFSHFPFLLEPEFGEWIPNMRDANSIGTFGRIKSRHFGLEKSTRMLIKSFE